MKIAIFHELHKGGARRGTNEFAKQLIKRGHKIDLYTIGEIQDDERLIFSNIYSYKFNSIRWNGHNWKAKLYKDTIELIKLCLLDRKVAKDINKKKYDLVYVAASFFIESPFILNFLEPPTFFYCNDPYYRIIYEPDLFNKTGVAYYKIWYEHLNRFLRKYLDKWNISKAKYIISISKFTNEAFHAVYGRKGTVIYYGVDTNFFRPSKKKKDIDLLFVGSRNLLDGYLIFEKVLKYVKTKVNVRTVLFEDEWLSDKDLLKTYQRSKILIAPAFREPLGLDPLEAQACGGVVIALNEGGHKETVVDKETGFLVKDNPREIAQKIDYLLNNQNILKQMSQNARKWIEQSWGWEKKGQEMENFLKQNK